MTALTCTVSEAAMLLGISRGLAYQRALAHGCVAPGVRAIRIGRRWVVPMCDIEANYKTPIAIA